MPPHPYHPSRRTFLSQALVTGAAVSLDPVLPHSTSGNQLPQFSAAEPISIRVSPPAGPPPLGAPVETSVPFGRGRLQAVDKLAVYSPEGKLVIAQTRPTLNWPDGSVRWLSVAFEAMSGPGNYVLQNGQVPSATSLVKEESGKILVDTGELLATISQTGPDWLETLGARGHDGAMRPLVKGPSGCDLVLTRHDGQVFRANLAGDTRHLVIEERGPVRASIRLEGQCRAQDGTRLFDCMFRWTVYRARPEIFLTVTWINATENPAEQVRDIRVLFPFEFEPDRLVFGCERGVYDGPFLKNWPVYILQEDHNIYWAKTHNPDGRIQNLSSGGCSGEHFPGWLYLKDQNHCLGVWVPNFWEEYPNEISLKSGELSVGLWPERAVTHLTTKPLLPANPFGDRPYSSSKYWPIMPHPYLAFVDREKKCLDAPQGVAKTQQIILSVWAGRGETPSFERKWWKQSLKPVRGHLEPAYVACTEALGKLWPRDTGHFPRFEQLFDESFGWLNRHIDQLKCYGKFDYGDFKYFTASTDYMCHPGTKWGEMGEMAREGYWHNNERDTLRGLLLYYFRSADPAVWERCQIAARHLLDLDIRHHPHWGMWTHGYGHCYLAQGEGGESDHSWLLGILQWAGLSGDAIVWDWVIRCADRLIEFKADFTQTDARTASVYLHVMCQFYLHTGQSKYLEAAEAPVQAFQKLQNPDGGWPAYLGNLKQPRVEGFVEHVVMALADYYSISGNPEILKMMNRAIVHLFGEKSDFKVDLGESPLTLYALAILAEKTGEARYVEVSKAILEKLHQNLNLSHDPYGRGDPWAQWGINNPQASEDSGRPPQFLGQTRPLTPSCVLAFGQEALAAIANQSGLACGKQIRRP